MRIKDIITPTELAETIMGYSRGLESLGKREDLKTALTKKTIDRVDDDYLKVLVYSRISRDEVAGAHFVLAMIDIFLEEKYAKSNSTAH